jgi:DNA helicase II / ATP-dependent DNA helicase PcrA
MALDLLYPGHDLSKTFAAVREEQEPVLAVRTAARRLDEVLARRYDNWDRRKGDFAILEKLAARYDTTAALLEALTLDPVTNTEADEEANRDAVTLITAHSAKGTESKLVYVVRAEPGMYPHVRSLGDWEREEEERRVLYVALTRAEDELIITRSCGAFEATTFSQTSGTPYLLDDLPADLVLYQAVDEIEDDDPFGPI